MCMHRLHLFIYEIFVQGPGVQWASFTWRCTPHCKEHCANCHYIYRPLSVCTLMQHILHTGIMVDGTSQGIVY